MELLLSLALLALGFVMLVKGADWFVGGAAGIATRMGIPQLVIGLTIVAMGTSAPEAAVSITAVLNGNAEICVGNIVGSNILNILIILGLSACLTSMAVQKSTIFREIPFMTVVTVVLLLQGLDGTISLVEGIILWALFLVYLGYLFWMSKKGDPAEADEISVSRPVWKLVLWTVIGLAVVVVGSKAAVEGATSIALSLGLSERLIGLTIVALGTSLPELFTSVAAARRGNADIAIGNIVGSNIFNILFVLGTSALISPVPFASPFIIDTIVAILTGALLFVCCLPHARLSRKCGPILLAAYAAYFVLVLL